MFREPLNFNMQDTGHGSHGPLTWDVIIKIVEHIHTKDMVINKY